MSSEYKKRLPGFFHMSTPHHHHHGGRSNNAIYIGNMKLRWFFCTIGSVYYYYFPFQNRAQREVMIYCHDKEYACEEKMRRYIYT